MPKCTGKRATTAKRLLPFNCARTKKANRAVDEIHYRAGYKFLTLVYQIDAGCRRLLYVGEDRKVKTLLRFFRRLSKERSALVFTQEQKESDHFTISQTQRFGEIQFEGDEVSTVTRGLQ